MKPFILITAILLIAIPASSQINTEQFNKERVGITESGMLILSSWGAANVVAGAIGQSSANKETKYFHQMNLIWGAVNLAIAAPAYFSVKRQHADLSLSASLKQQANIEKTFLFNAGLDLVYITSGLYCLEKGNQDSRHDLYRGYGKSLFVQGGGLLLFDVTMYLVHTRHEKKLYKILSNVQFSGNSAGISIKM
jgi:uncharacterized protein DUF6992